MERYGSGVSALLGLDGFVVCAQLLDEASGEWWLAALTTQSTRIGLWDPWDRRSMQSSRRTSAASGS